MKKLLSLLIISFVLLVTGCSKDVETQINEIVKNNVGTIANYHIKNISYFKADDIVVDDIEYNDVYVVKVASLDNSEYDINLILDKNIDLIATSNYILDSDNSLQYVYKMDILVNNQAINDSMYNKIIEN